MAPLAASRTAELIGDLERLYSELANCGSAKNEKEKLETFLSIMNKNMLEEYKFTTAATTRTAPYVALFLFSHMPPDVDGRACDGSDTPSSSRTAATTGTSNGRARGEAREKKEGVSEALGLQVAVTAPK